MDKATLERLADADAKEWLGLKRAVRDRIARALKKLATAGALRRSDIMADSDVSVAQASIDISVIRRRVPGLLHYDTREKCYRLKEGRK